MTSSAVAEVVHNVRESLARRIPARHTPKRSLGCRTVGHEHTLVSPVFPTEVQSKHRIVRLFPDRTQGVEAIEYLFRFKAKVPRTPVIICELFVLCEFDQTNVASLNTAPVPIRSRTDNGCQHKTSDATSR